MSIRDHIGGAAVIVAAIAFVVVAVPLLLTRDGDGPGDPAEPTFRTAPGEVTTIPEIEPDRAELVTEEIGAFLIELYEGIYVPDDATPEPTAEPFAGVAGLLTEPARRALASTPEIFLLDDLRISFGRISFEGPVTIIDAGVSEALLEIAFDARAYPVRGPATEVVVRQRGTIQLTQDAQVWRAEGFDLRSFVRPVPTPTPS